MGETPAIDAALAAAEPLLDIEGVHGIGQGESDGSPCVLVMVVGLTAEARATLPSTIEGFPVVLHDLGSPPTIEGTPAVERPADTEIEPDCA